MSFPLLTKHRSPCPEECDLYSDVVLPMLDLGLRVGLAIQMALYCPSTGLRRGNHHWEPFAEKTWDVFPVGGVHVKHWILSDSHLPFQMFNQTGTRAPIKEHLDETNVSLDSPSGIWRIHTHAGSASEPRRHFPPLLWRAFCLHHLTFNESRPGHLGWGIELPQCAVVWCADGAVVMHQSHSNTILTAGNRFGPPINVWMFAKGTVRVLSVLQ